MLREKLISNFKLNKCLWGLFYLSLRPFAVAFLMSLIILFFSRISSMFIFSSLIRRLGGRESERRVRLLLLFRGKTKVLR